MIAETNYVGFVGRIVYEYRIENVLYRIVRLADRSLRTVRVKA